MRELGREELEKEAGASASDVGPELDDVLAALLSVGLFA
jgi:hypothetical protein